MKVLITGITGLLGTALARTLDARHEVAGLCRAGTSPSHPAIQADLTVWRETVDAITKYNPDVVVHTAGESNVDACERNPDHAFRANALAARNVAAACQRFDAAMMYISTDYVFPGAPAPIDGYTEFDPVGPCSIYGRSKLQGESFVRTLLTRHYIVRTSWLFGAARANFVTHAAAALSAGNAYRAAADMVACPTSVDDLSAAIATLIETPLYGTYHLSNTGFASRYDIALFIADLVGAPRSLVSRVMLADLGLSAARPAFSALRNYHWFLNGLDPLRPWQTAVSSFLERAS